MRVGIARGFVPYRQMILTAPDCMDYALFVSVVNKNIGMEYYAGAKCPMQILMLYALENFEKIAKIFCVPANKTARTVWFVPVMLIIPLECTNSPANTTILLRYPSCQNLSHPSPRFLIAYSQPTC